MERLDIFSSQALLLAEQRARRRAEAAQQLWATVAQDKARLCEEVQQALRQREELMAIAAHELRTPLCTLRLWLESLRNEQGDDGHSHQEKVQRAERQLERIARLVDQLLDLSRLENGQAELHPEPLSLGDVATDVLARMSPDLERAGCPTTLHADADARGLWDRSRVEQVVTNLLTNAAKYGAGRPIAVRITRRDDEAILTVQDHGMGICPELQERIFECFGRSARAKGYPGLGLGLYLSRQIVEAHGGTISVESEPEHGATFHVMLPAGG